MIHTQKITDDPHGRFYVRHYPGDGEQGGKPRAHPLRLRPGVAAG